MEGTRMSLLLTIKSRQERRVPLLTDQQQPNRIPGLSLRSAVHARRNGTVGIIDRDAPEVPVTEGKRIRLCDRRIMEVVAMVAQKFQETVIVLPAIELEQFCAGFRNVDAPDGFIIAQTLACKSVIRTKPG